MLKTSCQLIVMIALVANTAYADVLPENEDSDSVMLVLVEKLSMNPAGDMVLFDEDSVMSQAFSYMGYILSSDSVLTYRLLTVETHFENDSIDIKLVIFDNLRAYGYYQIHHTFPYKILNYKYLLFDKTAPDFNGHPTHIKINLSAGIPQHFHIGDDEFFFSKFEAEHASVSGDQ